MSTYPDISDRRQVAGLTVRWVRRLAGWLGTAAAVVILAVLAGTATVMALGFRPLVEQSDSMAPAMRAGDVLFERTGTASEAGAGDVITFSDPERRGRTLTHRVVSVTPAKRGRLTFVTRGDANTGVERWRVRPDARIGRYGFRVPAVGRLLPFARGTGWRVLVLLAAAALALDVLRRIWRTPPRATAPSGAAIPISDPTTPQG
jgi:signal peptidase